MITENSKKVFITFFFSLRNNLYLYHLTTTNYARHVAVANLLEKFDELIDNFLEVLFGKSSRPTEMLVEKLELASMNDADAFLKLQEYIDFLINELPKLINENDSDLLNIRDEMVGHLNNTKYLFLLK